MEFPFLLQKPFSHKPSRRLICRQKCYLFLEQLVHLGWEQLWASQLSWAAVCFKTCPSQDHSQQKAVGAAFQLRNFWGTGSACQGTEQRDPAKHLRVCITTPAFSLTLDRRWTCLSSLLDRGQHHSTLEDGAQPKKLCSTAARTQKQQFPFSRAFDLVPIATTKERKMREGISHVLYPSFPSPCLEQLFTKYL